MYKQLGLGYSKVVAMAGRLLLLLLLCCCCGCCVLALENGAPPRLELNSTANGDPIVETWPRPFSPYNRIMAFVLSYDFGHMDPLLLILNEYISICEGGWNLTVVISTTANWTPTLHRYISEKVYCYRIGAEIPIRWDFHPANVSTALSAVHRNILGQELHNYDLFFYHEDDMIFKYAHIVGFLGETLRTHQLLPANGLRDHTIGFQRYRRLMRGNSHNPSNEADIIEAELFEEEPEFKPACLGDEPFLVVKGNIHQAVWMLTRHQVELLQQKCTFLNHSSASREHMSSIFLYSSPCNQVKLIPAERMQTFVIHHYFQGRHAHWVPIFTADQRLRSGHNYMSGPMATPACWAGVLNKTRELHRVANYTASRVRARLLLPEGSASGSASTSFGLGFVKGVVKVWAEWALRQLAAL